MSSSEELKFPRYLGCMVLLYGHYLLRMELSSSGNGGLGTGGAAGREAWSQKVYSIEYLEPLAQAAERSLRSAGYDERRVELRTRLVGARELAVEGGRVAKGNPHCYQ